MPYFEIIDVFTKYNDYIKEKNEAEKNRSEEYNTKITKMKRNMPSQQMPKMPDIPQMQMPQIPKMPDIPQNFDIPKFPGT